MKHALLMSFIVFSSSESFARRCVPDISGSFKFESRCEVLVTSTSTAECHILRSQGRFPEDYYPLYHVHPWERTRLTSTASACDVTVEDCKDLAFRELEKFSYTNNCGDVSVGKSVVYSFQTLAADGSVESEITGRMRK